MKVLASVIVELAPIFLVIWWWPDRRQKAGRRLGLDSLGAALIASGLCSYIGAKYFGLEVFGKRSVMTGEQASAATLFVAALGLGLFLLHYAFVAASPVVRPLWAFATTNLISLLPLRISSTVPTLAATVADIPAIVAKLATLKDGAFAVLMFDSPLSPGGDAVNLQYSVESSAVGLDWVLLSRTNVADKEKLSAFAAQRGHVMSEHMMNDVHYLRTEGGDIAELGRNIIVEFYGIPANANLDLITEGFEWPLRH